MVMKEEQERVRTLIADTVTLLCRNGLTYKSKFCINALIGITLDENDVFLLDIRETIKTAEDANSCDDNSLLSDETTPKKSTRKRQKRKRGAEKSKQAEAKDSGSEEVVDSDNDNSSNTFSEKIIKQETEDDDSEDLVFIKDEPGTQTVSSYTGPMGDEHSLTQQEQPLLGEDSLETMSPQQGALFRTSTLAPDTSAGPSSWSHQTPFPQIVQSTSTSDLKPKQLNHHDEQNESIHMLTTAQLSIPTVDKKGSTLCDLCGKTFVTKVGLENHRAIKHNATPRYTCQHCGRPFMVKSKYESHVNQHLGVKGHLCQICGKGFVHKKNLTDHVKSVHEGGNRIMCDLCGKYVARNNLSRHKSVHIAVTKTFNCAICHAAFKAKKYLQGHMKKKHK